MTIQDSTTALVNAINGYGTAVINRRKAGGQIIGPAYTKPTVVAFSTVPVFDASSSNVFQFAAMTAAVPGATIINGADGQNITIRIVQDATGGHVFTLPGNTIVTGTPSTAANAINLLVLTYDMITAKWEGSWVTPQP